MSNGEFVLDLSNYKERIGQNVPPGRYTVVVDDAELDTAKSGNQMVNLWFRVADGEHAGSVVLDRLVITEKSLFRIVGFMTALGLPTPKKRLALNTRKFMGRTLQVDVEDGEPYNGRVRSEVRGYLKAERQAVAQQQPEDIESPESVATSPNGSPGDSDILDLLEGGVDLDSLDL